MSFRVKIYSDRQGKSPIIEYLKSLPTKHKAKAIRTIDLLGEFGRVLKEPYAKHLEGNLWELRVKQGSDISRIVYFAEINECFVLLSGFIKKSKKTPAKELQKARIYLADYLRRFGK